MKVYLAGPMRGFKSFNGPAFDGATAKLRAAGHEVFSPIEQSRELYGAAVDESPDGNEKYAGIDGRKAFANDLQFICIEADAVALLPGWEYSKGATAEYRLAVALGLQIMSVTP